MAVTRDSRLSDHISIARRYVRSVDIARDLTDRAALDGYIATPSVRDALARLLRGLHTTSTHRAFRVTGPYGSGKSALGLLLARVVIERATRRGAAMTLLRTANLAAEGADVPPHVPLVLNGSHTRFSLALLDAIYNAANGGPCAVPSPALARDALALRSRSDDTERVLDLLSKYAERVSAVRKRSAGVLLLIDEMGRFLEYAAVHRAAEDVSIFQRLAERAAGPSDAPLAALAFLHHRFADYAAGFGSWAEAEWTRSAERYEDIALIEAAEETAFLIAQALTHTEQIVRSTRSAARTLYAEALSRGVFLDHEQLVDMADRLFPLHPATVACLAQLARRFGQYGRSVFGFLQSFEPFGFQRFIDAAPTTPASWFRLPNLYDYVAAQNGLTPRTTDQERRWRVVAESLAENPNLPNDETDTLKTVGILACLEPIAGLNADAQTIAWCLGVKVAAAEHALNSLVSRNTLYRRSHRGDYSPWASTSVDLATWVADGITRTPLPRRLDDVLTSFPLPRPLIAHRHYHTTGTLRAFAVRMANRGETLETIRPNVGECDGSIAIVLTYPDENVDAITREVTRASLAADPRVLCCIRAVTPDDLTRARDLAVWRWIETSCEELRTDDLARREVRARVMASEAALLSAIDPFGTSDSGEERQVWIHAGNTRTFKRTAELSSYLSDICDSVYAQGPIIKNELINRAVLSTAAASARMRLLELMADDATRENLGLVGTPPERSMYLSLFHASRMHRSLGDEGRWGFASPDPDDDPHRWRAAWEHLERYVGSRTACTVDEVSAFLAAPPLGIRAGVALLLVGAFLLHHAHRVALLERGSFVPALTGAHFMRMAKAPANFTLRYLPDAAATHEVLAALARDVRVWPAFAPPTMKAIVEALYGWWNSLPEFSRTTSTVSPLADAVRTVLRKAQDPMHLLLRELPSACGVGVVPTEIGETYDPGPYVTRLNTACAELLATTEILQRRAEAAVLDAFAAGSIGELRERIRTQYAPHSEGLTEYRLRSFVERSAMDLDDQKWLDSVASLTVGRRLEAWSDKTADEFAFEVRMLAQQLSRWVMVARAAPATVALAPPVATLHLTDVSGREQSLLVRRPRSHAASKPLAKIREVLANRPDARDLLVQLLYELVVIDEKEQAANE